MASPSEHYEQQAELALSERLHQCQTRLQLLKSISTRINSGLAANQIVERTLKETNKSFPRLRISYSVIDSNRVLRVLHSVGPAEAPALGGRDWPLTGVAVLEQVLAEGEVIVACDVDNDERLHPLRELLAAGATRALLVVPIPQPEQQTGLLSFAASEPHSWEAHEIATLTDMAEYLAIALREAHHERERLKIEQHLRDSQRVEAAGRLVGGIAHDFNNLLTGMMIYCGLLEVALGKEHRLQRHVHEIRSAGERGAELVAQLLASTSQQVLEPKVISINQVLMETQDMLRRLIREDIMLALRCDEDLRFTRVDPGQIQQVVLNLAINARDAMPDGGKLTVETANTHLDDAYARMNHEVQPGQYVGVFITDTGTGMAPETAAQAFEPFFTTKEIGQGTGLGLSQVYGFIKQSGGHVKIYSEIGEGTTVKLYLPRYRGEEDFADEKLETRGVPRGRGEVVLVVEDDPDVRDYTIEMVGDLGYSVVSASDGASALRLLDSHREVALLFTDVGLPGGMNGRQLAERALRRLPRLKVLYTTGYARNAIVHQGRLDPGVEVVFKPFTYSDLAAKIRQILDD